MTEQLDCVTIRCPWLQIMTKYRRFNVCRAFRNTCMLSKELDDLMKVCPRKIPWAKIHWAEAVLEITTA